MTLLILSFAWAATVIIFSRRNRYYQNPIHLEIFGYAIFLTFVLPLVLDQEVLSYFWGVKITIFLTAILIFTLPLLTRSDVVHDKIKVGTAVGTKVYSIMLLIYLLSQSLRLYAITNGMVYGTHLNTHNATGAFGNILSQMLNAPYWFYLLLLFSVKNKHAKMLIGLTIIECCWFVLTGSKSLLFIVLLPYFMMRVKYCGFRLTDVRVVLYSLIIFILVSFIFDFIKYYRVEMVALLLSGELTFQSILEAVAFSFSEVIWAENNQNYNADNFGDRINYARYLGRIIEYDYKFDDHWYGASLLPLLTWFIPRFIYPDKPSISIGRWYAETILGWSDDSRSEAAMTVAGDGYLNFGIFGILIFCIIWFLILRKFLIFFWSGK